MVWPAERYQRHILVGFGGLLELCERGRKLFDVALGALEIAAKADGAPADVRAAYGYLLTEYAPDDPTQDALELGLDVLRQVVAEHAEHVVARAWLARVLRKNARRAEHPITALEEVAALVRDGLNSHPREPRLLVESAMAKCLLGGLTRDRTVWDEAMAEARMALECSDGVYLHTLERVHEDYASFLRLEKSPPDPRAIVLDYLESAGPDVPVSASLLVEAGVGRGLQRAVMLGTLEQMRRDGELLRVGHLCTLAT